MAKQQVFISSVQSEFAKERQALHDYILSDSLLGRFFDPFIFENLAASDQRTDSAYLQQIEYCRIYVILIGKKYGSEDEDGISPSEHEFNYATKLSKTRLAFITNHKPEERELKETHSSVPANPLLAEPMYLKAYIERLGTGTLDIIRIATKNDLPEPKFEQNNSFKAIIYRPSTHQEPTKYPPSTHQVNINKLGKPSVEIYNLLKIINGEMSRQEIQVKLELKDRRNFRENYLNPALTNAYIEMKYPDKPNHPRQKYFITKKGKNALNKK